MGFWISFRSKIICICKSANISALKCQTQNGFHQQLSNILAMLRRKFKQFQILSISLLTKIHIDLIFGMYPKAAYLDQSPCYQRQDDKEASALRRDIFVLSSGICVLFVLTCVFTQTFCVSFLLSGVFCALSKLGRLFRCCWYSMVF